MLYGTSDAEPQTDIIVAQLAQELYNTNLLLLLIQVSVLANNQGRSLLLSFGYFNTLSTFFCPMCNNKSDVRAALCES